MGMERVNHYPSSFPGGQSHAEIDLFPLFPVARFLPFHTTPPIVERRGKGGTSLQNGNPGHRINKGYNGTKSTRLGNADVFNRFENVDR